MSEIQPGDTLYRVHGGYGRQIEVQRVRVTKVTAQSVFLDSRVAAFNWSKRLTKDSAQYTSESDALVAFAESHDATAKWHADRRDQALRLLEQTR